MCGRFANFTPPASIGRLVKPVNPPPNVAPSWNIAPSQQAMAVRRHPKTGERYLDLLTWGFISHWAKDLKAARKPINARAETVAATSRMFRAAFAHNRCLMPADAYYEGQTAPDSKHPFAFARRDQAPMMIAGIWDIFQREGGVLRTFSLLTTEANDIARPIHDRMQVIVESGHWPVWLGEEDGDVTGLLQPADDSILRVWPVSKHVNSPPINDAILLEGAS